MWPTPWRVDGQYGASGFEATLLSPSLRWCTGAKNDAWRCRWRSWFRGRFHPMKGTLRKNVRANRDGTRVEGIAISCSDAGRWGTDYGQRGPVAPSKKALPGLHSFLLFPTEPDSTEESGFLCVWWMAPLLSGRGCHCLRAHEARSLGMCNRERRQTVVSKRRIEGHDGASIPFPRASSSGLWYRCPGPRQFRVYIHERERRLLGLRNRPFEVGGGISFSGDCATRPAIQ